MGEVSFAEELNELLIQAGLEQAGADLAKGMEAYLELLIRWNARTNLTAVRDREGILSLHLIECMACARILPADIGTLLDFGSGAGLPGIPIALCRPEIVVTLAESQGKKAAFLREAVRTIGFVASVHSGRAEMISTRFDCVILRAVDKMPQAIKAATGLVAPHGWLALMTTDSDLDHLEAGIGVGLSPFDVYPLAGSEQRILALARNAGAMNG
jgi:16S rRNA (guanine527-N7)-methyltransferase